ncbi:glycoside hydrolase family 88 protein [Paenibacillus glycanilyticus]|uniref:glycoside hydrolase family 88 protein n=1 Tax=Paenibacillus glycanilyticus TaxID=126569 RepID=UPI000FD8B281|nr:glycoside hydrolase family 88 protein [Paenibacillus glycanilyticus]
MYVIANDIKSPSLNLPDGQRVPFDWKAKPVLPDGLTITELHWHSQELLETDHARLRITVAVDVRENKRIEVIALRTRNVLGTLDIRYAHVFQIFELPLGLNEALIALKEGVGLRMIDGEAPLWFFAGNPSTSSIEPVHLPHLMIGDAKTPLESFEDRFNSLASIQPFGWMEGCVLDGLLDAGFNSTARRHLELFVKNNDLVYEDPRSRPSDGCFYGIESTLPIAMLTKLDPTHSLVDCAVQFMKEHTDQEGIIKDGDTLSAEGSYTIAYPLSVIAAHRGDRELAWLAFKQLELRRALLWEGGALYLRRQDDGTRSFRNWGRAYAWHLLGLIRTLEQLKDKELLNGEQLRFIEEEYSETLRKAFEFRSAKGLWSCFVDEVESGVDTSASAGIAASLAIADRIGIRLFNGKADAAHTAASLCRYLTPDGLMTGTAQSNKNGEELQRSGYRVISQMAMGLLGQLSAAVSHE